MMFRFLFVVYCVPVLSRTNVTRSLHEAATLQRFYSFDGTSMGLEYCFDPVIDEVKVERFFTSVEHIHSVARLENTLYVFGTSLEPMPIIIHPVAVLSQYNLESNEEKTYTTSYGGRHRSAAITVSHDRILILGGIEMDSGVTRTTTWFHGGDHFTPGPNMLYERYHPVVAYVDGKVFVLGSAESKKVEVLDTNVPDAQFEPRHDAIYLTNPFEVCVAVLGDAIYLFDDQIQKYSIKEDKWTLLRSKIPNWSRLYACVPKSNKIEIYNEQGRIIYEFRDL